MKRIILHWTGGKNQPCNTDYEHYHYLVNGDGVVVKGKYTPEDNLNCYDDKYAQHTGGGNTGSIGVSLCGMYVPTKTPIQKTKYPLTKKQCESTFKLCAELCKKYGLTITKQTVLIRSSKYTIYNHRHKENLDRTLYIQDILFNKIPKHQKGQVFLKVNVPNYDTLLNTHVYLFIKHNIPLNVICKNIGYTCFDNFLNRFDFALSHDFIHKIDILDVI